METNREPQRKIDQYDLMRDQMGHYDLDGMSQYTDRETTLIWRDESQKEKIKMNTGINEKDREKMVQGLSRILADTYTLYLKTHNFHWNVTGSRFQMLHCMFEEEYEELSEAVDLIAERIRALGFRAPATYTEFQELSAIKEDRGPLTAEQMIAALVEGHETVARTTREFFPLAEKADDDATADLLTQRMKVHEKAAWMLRSHLN